MPFDPARRPRVVVESLESRSLYSASLPASEAPVSPDAGAALEAAATLRASVTALRISAASTVVGQPVTLRASVAGVRTTGVPTGTVTFTVGKTTLGTATIRDGVARLSTTNLPLGRATVIATYSGSGKFAASAAARRFVSTQSATINRLSVVTAAETAESTFGTPVALVARISNADAAAGVPTGRVAFYENGVLLGSKRLNSAGVARLTTPNFFTGSHTVRAVYGGSTVSLAQRSAARTFTVNVPTLTDAPNGLRSASVVPGTGAASVAGNTITANYTGYLLDGTLFETSLGAQPFQFQLGAGGVIAGFDQGLAGIKAGETRVLVIPPELGYGAQANGNIPANSTLIFIVTAVSIA